MKLATLSFTVAAFALAGAALADPMAESVDPVQAEGPRLLTDAEMENTVAGTATIFELYPNEQGEANGFSNVDFCIIPPVANSEGFRGQGGGAASTGINDFCY